MASNSYEKQPIEQGHIRLPAHFRPAALAVTGWDGWVICWGTLFRMEFCDEAGACLTMLCGANKATTPWDQPAFLIRLTELLTL